MPPDVVLATDTAAASGKAAPTRTGRLILWSRPPAFLLVIAGIAAAIGVGMSFVGAATTGISVDDPRHATRLDVFYETGLYTTRAEQHAARAAIPAEAYVYGPVTALIQHATNRLLGNDEPATADRTPSAYTTRHLVVGVLGLIGLLATGAIASVVLGDKRWGVVAVGALAAIPLWTGHVMFNVKDTPVASGHTLATLGLVLLATSRDFKLGRRQVVGALALAVGTILMLGTRPGMWPSLAASVTIFVAVLAWCGELRSRTVAALCGALTVSYTVLLASYPRVYSHPFALLWRSATSSADFSHLQHPHGRGYLPLHVVEELPIILLSLVAAGTVVVFTTASAFLRARSAEATGPVLVASQAFTLPVLGVAYGSAFYQGLRQVLFSVPAAAILATVGLAALISRASSARTRVGWAAIGGIGLVLPMVVQATLFPYQYSYLNVAADASGASMHVDYLGTSYRALLPYVRKDIKLVCPQMRSSLARNIGDCRTRPRGQFSTYWRATGQRAYDFPKRREYYAILRGPWTTHHCRTKHEITRRSNLHKVVISRLVRCEPPATRRNTPPTVSVNPWDSNWTG